MYSLMTHNRICQHCGKEFLATVRCLGVIMLRIAIILTALRCMDTGKVPEKIECADSDFDTSLSIIKTVSHHIDYIFNVLNEGLTEEVKVSETYSSAARATLLSILPDHFTPKDMKAAALKINKSVRTVERQVRRAIQKGQVKELGKGSYQKISQQILIIPVSIEGFTPIYRDNFYGLFHKIPYICKFKRQPHS